MRLKKVDYEMRRTRKVTLKFLVALDNNDDDEKYCLDTLLSKSGTKEAKDAAVKFMADVTGMFVTPCDSDRVVIEIEGWPPKQKRKNEKTKKSANKETKPERETTSLP